MGWAETRNKARRVVHNTFALLAVYTSPLGVVTAGIHARMHNEKKEFGDLDREGFALSIEDVNQVIFDGNEIVPEKKGVIDFGGSKVFIITNILPKTTDEFMRVEVTLA